MSVMGFTQNYLDGGERGELYSSLVWIFGMFLTLQSPLLTYTEKTVLYIICVQCQELHQLATNNYKHMVVENCCN